MLFREGPEVQALRSICAQSIDLQPNVKGLSLSYKPYPKFWRRVDLSEDTFPFEPLWITK